MKLITQSFPHHIQLLLNFYALIRNRLFFIWEGERVYSHTEAFRNHDLVQEGEKIKERYLSFFENIGLRKEVYLIEYTQPTCCSCGYNWYLSKESHAGIFMSKGLLALDEEAFGFVLKHEIAHIKFSDVFMRSLLSLFSLGLFAWIASYFFELWSIFILVFCAVPLIYHYLGGVWMRYREHRADLFAMKHSSVEEIKGAVRYFSAMKQYNASLSSTSPHYTPEGELVYGFHYPKTSQRIKAFVAEIKKRTGAPYEPEQEAIDRHVALLQTNNESLQKILSRKIS